MHQTDPDSTKPATTGHEHEIARTISLVVLACIAGAFALYLGREFFQPIAIAFLMTAALRPVVRTMHAMLHVPTALGAAIVVITIMLAWAALVGALTAPVQNFIESAPQSFAAAERRVDRLMQSFRRVRAAADRIEKAAQAPTSTPSTQSSQSAAPAAAAPSPIGIPGGGLLAHLFGTTTLFLGGLLEVLVLLYLLLASGDLFLQKLVRMLPVRREKQAARSVVHEIEHVIMRYLLVLASINLCQAVLITLVMWWLKMPSPLLLGVFCFVLEFIPYLGAAIMVTLIAVTSFATFDHLGHILAPPICYFCMTTLNTSLLSPYAYGARLKLNPVAVLIGVLLWWYLWGVPGAFVAVPILAGIRIAAEHTESLKAVGEFLAE